MKTITRQRKEELREKLCDAVCNFLDFEEIRDFIKRGTANQQELDFVDSLEISVNAREAK